MGLHRLTLIGIAIATTTMGSAAVLNESPTELASSSLRLQFRLDKGAVHAVMLDASDGRVLADSPYFYRATVPTEDGSRVYEGLAGAAIANDGGAVVIHGNVGPLSVVHRFEVRNDRIEETMTLTNAGTSDLAVSSFETGFIRKLTDGRGRLLDEVKADRLVAIPFRHRATDPEDVYHDFTMQDTIATLGSDPVASDPFVAGRIPSLRRSSEGWAWVQGGRTLGVFKFNQGFMEFSVVSLVPNADGASLRFGGAATTSDQSLGLDSLAPGATVEMGATSYVMLPGGYVPAYYAFRDMLDDGGCRFPDTYNPPVHWNELYDNPEWNLMSPGRPPGPRNTRPYTYTRALIEEEAAKAKAYGCEALYLDPGWDTHFGSFIWGEEWLGSEEKFVRDMREKYGLAVSLHCPLATWTDMENIGVPDWPAEAARMDVDGTLVPDSLCLGSKQYLDEAAKRLTDHCAKGVAFLMFDGNWYNGGCWNPAHGHPIPYTKEAHCRANEDLAHRVHAQYPDVLIEMHDMITGGSSIRHTPVYYTYGAPGSYDDNWGLELMWSSMEDIRSGRARSLFYYNLACNVPMYLHVDLRDDNEHCMVLWWYASTCRHLGIGGTHPDPIVAERQRLAMARYRELERYFKRGRFYAMQEVGIVDGPNEVEEVHLHVLPEEGGLVVTMFNLSNEERRITGGVPVDVIGLPKDVWYHGPKGMGFNPSSGWFHVDRVLPPWGTYVAEVRMMQAP